VNDLHSVSTEVVEAARDSLVISRNAPNIAEQLRHIVLKATALDTGKLGLQVF
jgi:hypothetical protein